MRDSTVIYYSRRIFGAVSTVLRVQEFSVADTRFGFEHAGDAPAGKAGIDLQRQTLPGEAVDHAQDAESAVRRPSRRWQSPVSPLLVGRRQHWPRLKHPPQMLAPCSLHAKAQFAIHALYLLVVHSHLLVQIQMQTPIAKARMLTRQFAQPFLNLAVISSASIPATRSRHRHQLADVARNEVNCQPDEGQI